MNPHRAVVLCAVTCFLLLAGCSKTTEEQMQEYIEFYYPTTGQYTYEIMFDWGSYVIVTGANADEELHTDSQPYRGYTAMRPQPNPGGEKSNFSIYLITPEGDVVIITSGGEIPELKSRDEVTVEKTEYGTSTQTVTIQSPLEPVVDHFLAHRDQWRAYGKVESVSGRSTFQRISP